MRISDWSSDVCSSDLSLGARVGEAPQRLGPVDPGALGPAANSDLAAADVETERDRLTFGDRGDEARVLQCRSAHDHAGHRSEEHTSELQSLMRTSYAVFCLRKQTTNKTNTKNIIRHTT